MATKHIGFYFNVWCRNIRFVTENHKKHQVIRCLFVKVTGDKSFASISRRKGEDAGYVRTGPLEHDP